MQDKNDNYIYIHRRKDTGAVFYVGHGRADRAEGKGRSKTKEWKVIESAAGGHVVEKLHENLSKSEAIDLEEQYIKNPHDGWELVNRRLPTRTNSIPREVLVDRFYYDPGSPSGLRHKENCYAGKGALSKAKGSVAGTKHISNRKYHHWVLQFKVAGVRQVLKNHRVIWIITNGDIPENSVVDHVDGNSLNNSIDNLRLVSQKVNLRNVKPRTNSKTGVTGVFLSPGRYYMTTWVDVNDNSACKSFSIKKHGESLAFELACYYRHKMVSGRDFTDRHIGEIPLKILESYSVDQIEQIISNNTYSSNLSGFRGIQFKVNALGNTIITARKTINNKNYVKRFNCNELGIIQAHALAMKWYFER